MLDKENLTVLTDAISKIMNKESVTEEIEIELNEASITTSTDFDDYPIDKQAKKFNLKVKKMPDEGDGINGYDLMTLTGSEKDIVSYFVKFMGANKKDTIKDLEQEFGESTEITEKLKAARGKSVLDIDFAGDETEMDGIATEYKIKMKKGKIKGTALVAGENKNILAYLQSDDYDMDDENIMDIYPEVVAESYDRNKLVNKMMKPIKDKEALKGKGKDTKKEASGGKEEYEKFFTAALKKFGVKSPAELKGDKEKEFYNYIDKNWDAKTETDEDLEEGLGLKDLPPAFIHKNRDAETGREVYNVMSDGFKSLGKFKNIKDAEKFLDKYLKKFESVEESVNEHVGANGHAGPVQDINQGLSPKAKLVKAFQEPEVPEYADANKTALSTFANIMNSVNVAMDYRASDNKVQDVAPENTIQKLANSTK
jgi:hypothetical protein